jgi:hypothetical protein
MITLVLETVLFVWKAVLAAHVKFVWMYCVDLEKSRTPARSCSVPPLPKAR